MMLPLTYIVGLYGMIIGSITDLQKREVADWVNFSLIISGFGINLILSINHSDTTYILNSIIGFAFSVAIGYLMYYTGQWGGGDSKMIMGFGALFGLAPSLKMQFLTTFYINILFAGAFYGLIWLAFLSIKEHKTLFKKMKKELKKKNIKKMRIIISLFSIISLVAVFFTPEYIYPPKLKYVSYSLIIFIYLLFYLWLLVKNVEKVCLIKKISPEKLTEGDWIVSDINIDGNHICGPKDLGIEEKQIDLLIKLKEQGKIKTVTIKNGIPFVPSFLIGFIYTIIFNNIAFISPYLSTLI